MAGASLVVQVAEQGEGQGAGDGRGAHIEHVGIAALAQQLQALAYTKTMLLVHDHQAQVVELGLLRAQGVGAEHQHGLALAQFLLPPAVKEIACDHHHVHVALVEILGNAAQRAAVLWIRQRT